MQIRIHRTVAAAIVITTCGLGLGVDRVAAAQVYPTKPIRIVVAFSAGGGTDVVARTLADRVGQRLKQPVVVENRPGANGMIAADYVARSPKDGYTLLFTINSHVLSTLLYQKPTYRLEDFTPVSAVVNNYLVMFYSPAKLGTGPAKDVVANMHKRQVSYASYGVGSLAHLYGEQLARAGKFDLLHIAYKGQTEAVGGMMTGDVDSAFLGPQSASQFADSKAKILAVAAEKRLGSLPDTPTFTELGIPSLDRGTFLGLLAPAGTPATAVKAWEVAVKEVLAEPDFQQRMKALYMEPVGSTSAEFQKVIDDDMKFWAPLVKTLNIKLD